MYKINLLILMLFSHLFMNAQTIIGHITNYKNQQSVPFANVSIKGTYKGTISDINGNYKLNIPSKSNSTICFSCIGFETLEVNQKELIKQPVINLQASTINISEVVVMPDSTLRGFLRKAYNKIPENYPSKPSTYNIFYREGLKDNHNNYLRLSEVLSTAYKSSYDNKQEGTINVSKSRKYNNSKRANEFPLIYYGGIHMFHSSDDVKMRKDFLKPHHTYDYELIGIDKYDGRKVYIIGFEPKPNKVRKNYGRIYIDVETLAYLKIVKHSTRERQNKRYIKHPGYKSLGIETTINYSSKDSFVYFQSMHHAELVQHKDSVYKQFAEVVVSAIQVDSVDKIPFSKQIPISYMPIIDAVDYASSDWKGYATLPSNIKVDTLKETATFNLPLPKLSLKEVLVKTLQRVEWSTGLNYSDYETNVGNHSLNYKQLNFEHTIDNSASSISRTSSYLLKLTKNHGIIYNYNINISNKQFLNSNSLCYHYRLPIKTIGKNIFANAQVGYSWLNYGQYVGKSKVEDDFKFGGKSFNSEYVYAYTGLKQNGYQANISAMFQISNLFYISIGGGYFASNKNQETLYFKESKGLFKRSANEPLNGNNIEYKINDKPSNHSGVKNNNWQLNLTIALIL